MSAESSGGRGWVNCPVGEVLRKIVLVGMSGECLNELFGGNVSGERRGGKSESYGITSHYARKKSLYRSIA